MNKTTVTGSLSEAGKIIISEPERRQLGSISLWFPWAQSLQAPVLLIPQGQASPGVTESCLFVFPGQSSEYGDEKTTSNAGTSVLECGPDWWADTC